MTMKIFFNFFVLLMFVHVCLVCVHSKKTTRNSSLALGNRKKRASGTDDIFIDINQSSKWGIFNFQVSKIRLELQELAATTSQRTLEIPAKASKDFLEEKKKILETKIKDVLSLLDEPKHQAEDQGVNISECISEQVKEIKHLPDNINELIEKCVEEQMKKIQSYMAEVRRTIQEDNDELTAMINRLDECKKSKDASKMYCASTLTNKVDRAVEELPHKIARISAEAREYVLNFQQYFLPLCTINDLTQVAQGGESIMEQIAQCLSQKYPNIDVRALGRGLSDDSSFLRSSIPIVMMFVISPIAFI